MATRLLFVCIGNACRSPMAEAIGRHLARDGWEIASAGTSPAGWVSPEVRAALAEKDIPAEGLRSKGLEEVQPARFDLVVILSGHAPSTIVPEGFAGRVVEWPLPDPVGGPLHEYREVRDVLLERIPELLRDDGKSTP